MVRKQLGYYIFNPVVNNRRLWSTFRSYNYKPNRQFLLLFAKCLVSSFRDDTNSIMRNLFQSFFHASGWILSPNQTTKYLTPP